MKDRALEADGRAVLRGGEYLRNVAPYRNVLIAALYRASEAQRAHTAVRLCAVNRIAAAHVASIFRVEERAKQ
jgi:hypothetical protein